MTETEKESIIIEKATDLKLYNLVLLIKDLKVRQFHGKLVITFQSGYPVHGRGSEEDFKF